MTLVSQPLPSPTSRWWLTRDGSASNDGRRMFVFECPERMRSDSLHTVKTRTVAFSGRCQSAVRNQRASTHHNSSSQRVRADLRRGWRRECSSDALVLATLTCSATHTTSGAAASPSPTRTGRVLLTSDDISSRCRSAQRGRHQNAGRWITSLLNLCCKTPAQQG
jgi:hypothetical protein